MVARKIRWAVNRPTNGPVIIDGIVADVDPETGEATLDRRGQEVVDEVVAAEIMPTKAYIVPAIDLPHAVHLLIAAKRLAGVPLRARLPHGSLVETPMKADGTGNNPRYPQEIDYILLAMYERMLREQVHLLGKATDAVPLDTLRDSVVGNALRRLWRIADEHEHATTGEIDALRDLVYSYLPTGLDKTLSAFFSRVAENARPHAPAHHG